MDTQFLCTRSREARLRDEPSKAENSGAGKRPRHERQRGQHREERQTERIKRLWGQECNRKRKMDNSSKR